MLPLNGRWRSCSVKGIRCSGRRGARVASGDSLGDLLQSLKRPSRASLLTYVGLALRLNWREAALTYYGSREGTMTGDVILLGEVAARGTTRRTTKPAC